MARKLRTSPTESNQTLRHQFGNEVGDDLSLCPIEAGESATRFETDHEPLFRQESYFAYLFGCVEPDYYGSVDLG